MYSKRETICYHTRLDSDNRIKITGGMTGGRLDMDTANSLVNRDLKVIVKPSGRPVFVDGQGREVSLYMSVHPELTEKGKAAIVEDRKARELAGARARAKQSREEEELNDAMAGLTHEEILKRLKGPL